METLLLAIAAAQMTARVRVPAPDGGGVGEQEGDAEDAAEADQRDGELSREYK